MLLSPDVDDRFLGDYVNYVWISCPFFFVSLLLFMLALNGLTLYSSPPDYNMPNANNWSFVFSLFL